MDLVFQGFLCTFFVFILSFHPIFFLILILLIPLMPHDSLFQSLQILQIGQKSKMAKRRRESSPPGVSLCRSGKRRKRPSESSESIGKSRMFLTSLTSHPAHATFLQTGQTRKKQAQIRRKSPPPGVPYCRPCNKTFRKPENLILHNNTQHMDVVEKFLCEYWPNCKDSKHEDGLYSTLSNLRVHFKKHHKILSDVRRKIKAKRAEIIYCRKIRKE